MVNTRSTTETAPKAIVKIPAPLILAVLVSYFALYLYVQANSAAQETIIVLVILGIALIGSRLARFRMAHSSRAPWILRIVGILFFAGNFPQRDGSPLLFNPAVVALLGMIWGIEAAIQAWRERPWGNPPGASLILLSSLTFVSASTVGDETNVAVFGNYVAYLTPVFLLLIVLSFRALETSSIPGLPTHLASVLRIDKAPRRVGNSIALLRFMALLLAIGIGFACWWPVHMYRSQISTWGNQLLESHPAPETAGLSSAPALGDMFNADGSPTRVLRIDNYHGDPHMRGLCFDTYTKGRWLPAEDSVHFEPTTGAAMNDTARGDHATVHCYVSSLKEIVAPLNVAGIAPGAGTDVEAANAAGVVFRVNTPAPYTYDLIEANGPYQGLLCPPLTPAERVKCLNVPPDIDPKVIDLAHKIWADAVTKAAGSSGNRTGLTGTPFRFGNGPSTSLSQAKIAAVDHYILSHYTYALKSHPGAGDKVSNFLLHENAGHCEYFASAAVILLRALGVPSRYVTGYYAHESEGSSTVVRQRDSHAWTECWIDGVGWVTVDTTPGGGRPDQLYPSAAATTRIWEWLADRVTDAQTYLARFTPAQLSAGVAGLGIAFYGIRWLFLIAKRRRRAAAVKPVAYDNRAEALRDMAVVFDKYLADHNVPCPPNSPWQEHLELLRIPSAPNSSSPVPPGLGARGPEPKANGTGLVNTVDASARVDVLLALDFVREYNALRFRKSFNAERAAETRALLDQLVSTPSAPNSTSRSGSPRIGG